MKKRMLSMVMAVLMSCTLFVGCGSTSSGTKSEDTKKSVTEASDSTDDGELLASIKSKGKLTIGTASGYPPYEFVDAASGDQSVIGIDIELAQAIADKLGVKLEVQDMNFSSLLTSLSAGKVDMAIAGISPTDERKETYDFSDSYLFADQSIIINKSDADKYKSLDDFKGKTLAAEKSTTQEALCQEKMPDCPLTSLEKVPDCILELKNGKADGVVVESIVGEQYILSDDTLQFADATFGTKKESAIAMNKNNDDLLTIVNKVIKENQDNGNFDKWVEEYSKIAAESAK